MRLRYKSGYDPQRFVADFDLMINQYVEMETHFPEEHITTVFLQKIEGINDNKSPFCSFYSTIASLPNENQNLKYIRGRFLRIAPPASTTNGVKPNRDQHQHQSDQSNAKKRPGPTQKPEDNSATKAKSLRAKYTVAQLESLSKMSVEEKKAVQCKKCGEYFHKEKECPNPGKMCYGCFKYGHTGIQCKNPRVQQKGNELTVLFKNNKFNVTYLFLVNSPASHHIVCDKNSASSSSYRSTISSMAICVASVSSRMSVPKLGFKT